jgi:hypothetical protein
MGVHPGYALADVREFLLRHLHLLFSGSGSGSVHGIIFSQRGRDSETRLYETNGM